jgi:ABC-type phosphate transport system substrate-binding protein
MARAWSLLAAVVLAASLSPAHARAQYVVVVHEANPITSIGRSDLSNLLLGRETHWKHGLRATPLDLPVTSRVRQVFSMAVIRQSAAAVRSYWQQQQFAGRGTPPRERATERDVLESIRLDPGAVGYISVTTPLEPGTRALVVLP